MKILITGAASRLGQALATELGREHTLRLMDTVPVETGERAEAFPGSLLEPDDAWRAVRDVQAVIHTGEPPPDMAAEGLAREQRLLDLATRGTHILCKAAGEAGVKKILYAGTLAIFRAYPDDVYISELWKPLPGPEMETMARYLGELTCREFARDYLMTVTGLRLGELVLEEEVAGQPPNLMWLDLRDAAQAFRCALSRDNSSAPWFSRRWRLVHVAAPLPHPKFLFDAATRMGYRAEHGFGGNFK
jgi:nucleoside-diphosphate-sugar epimerase